MVVKTNYPSHQIMKKPDLASIMVSYLIELSKYDTNFVPREIIQSQVFESSLVNNRVSHVWILSVDDTSNLKGSHIGVVLEGPGNIPIEKSLTYNFKANNN